jgi:hypothetical protein
MAPSRESSCRLHDEPVSPLQLATHVRDDEEEVPNVKRMHIVEEVSLLQPVTTAVPLEEEQVPVPHGPAIVVPPDE